MFNLASFNLKIERLSYVLQKAIRVRAFHAPATRQKQHKEELKASSQRLYERAETDLSAAQAQRAQLNHLIINSLFKTLNSGEIIGSAGNLTSLLNNSRNPLFNHEETYRSLVY